MKKTSLHLWAKGFAFSGLQHIALLAIVLLHGAVAFAQTAAPVPKPAAPAAPVKPEQDIIENLNMVTPDGPWWYWWIIASSVLVMLIPLFFVFRRLYRKKMLPFQAQPVPPETSALERLASIRHYIEEGAVRDFVRESSDILRSYIEARFGLKAPRLSTEEFLYEAEHSPHLDAAHRAKLAEFLFRCDRVKFGLGDLDTSRMESLYAAAEDFIKNTGSTATSGTASAPAASKTPAPNRVIMPSAPPPSTTESVKAERVTKSESESAKSEVAG